VRSSARRAIPPGKDGNSKPNPAGTSAGSKPPPDRKCQGFANQSRREQKKHVVARPFGSHKKACAKCWASKFLPPWPGLLPG